MPVCFFFLITEDFEGRMRAVICLENKSQGLKLETALDRAFQWQIATRLMELRNCSSCQCLFA